MGKTNLDAQETIYQLKVTLKWIKPPIWRRIQVPGSITMFKLHRILQEVMGWENYHLYRFKIGGIYFGKPDDEMDVENVFEYKLKDLVTGEKKKIIYVYDFGDGWEHEIVVEKILPPKPDKSYPVCLKGKRACPPEDCGGPGGYYDLVAVLQNPGHPEYNERRSWSGDFDPEYFDLEIINEKLVPYLFKKL